MFQRQLHFFMVRRPRGLPRTNACQFKPQPLTRQITDCSFNHRRHGAAHINAEQTCQKLNSWPHTFMVRSALRRVSNHGKAIKAGALETAFNIKLRQLVNLTIRHWPHGCTASSGRVTSSGHVASSGQFAENQPIAAAYRPVTMSAPLRNAAIFLLSPKTRWLIVESGSAVAT